MTAIGVLQAVTATIDALCHGRLLSAAATSTVRPPALAAVEMDCPRCGQSVKATFPPDDGEGLAFECDRCGGVARWV